MVTIVKHEWHSHDRQYAIDLDINILSEIYSDLSDEELEQKLADIESGEISVDDVIEDALDNDVDLGWQFQYDDCYSDRKGGYLITYELGDDNSWVEFEEQRPPSHKCKNCRWQGDSWQTLTQFLREDGTVINNYYDSDEDSHSTKEVCPMCDGDLALTEYGLQEEIEAKKRLEKLELNID